MPDNEPMKVDPGQPPPPPQEPAAPIRRPFIDVPPPGVITRREAVVRGIEVRKTLRQLKGEITLLELQNATAAMDKVEL
jgi:hypothetical protein